MAVSAKWYGLAFVSAFNKEINLNLDGLKMMLCSSSYAPNQDTHRYKSDVTNEVAGTGYTAGGKALTSATIGYTGSTNVLKFDADDVVWSGATITARYAVIYDDFPSGDGAKPLLVFIDFGADVTATAAAFTVSFDPAGIATVTVA